MYSSDAIIKDKRTSPEATASAFSPAAFYAFGVFFSWLTIVVGYAASPGSRAMLSGELERPDPLTCTAGSCWDGAIKYGYPACTWGSGQTVLGIEIPKGGQTCYKSIYYNLETNAALALAVWICFCALIARMIEYLLTLAFVYKSLRWSVLVPLVCNFVGLYYSFSVVFIYINEYIADMLRSQLFFSGAEFLTTLVLVGHANTSIPVNHTLMNIVAGNAMLHAFQMLGDEWFSMSARNILLLTGDLAVLFFALRLTSITDGKAWVYRFAFAIGGMIVFQLFFADDHSLSVFV